MYNFMFMYKICNLKDFHSAFWPTLKSFDLHLKIYNCSVRNAAIDLHFPPVFSVKLLLWD